MWSSSLKLAKWTHMYKTGKNNTCWPLWSCFSSDPYACVYSKILFSVVCSLVFFIVYDNFQRAIYCSMHFHSWWCILNVFTEVFWCELNQIQVGEPSSWWHHAVWTRPSGEGAQRLPARIQATGKAAHEAGHPQKLNTIEGMVLYR